MSTWSQGDWILGDWALFDETKRYRYRLRRNLSDDGLRILWVMLNPSTADAFVLDPTVNRCVGYSRAWGYATMEVVNIFAWRSTDPRALYRVDDPIGPDNDAAIADAAEMADFIVLAWGNHGQFKNRGYDVATMLRRTHDVHALTVTKQGHPGHPLYLPGSLKPRRFNGSRGTL